MQQILVVFVTSARRHGFGWPFGSCGCLARQDVRGLVCGHLACCSREEEENKAGLFGLLTGGITSMQACVAIGLVLFGRKASRVFKPFRGETCGSRPDGPFRRWALVRAGSGLKICLLDSK